MYVSRMTNKYICIIKQSGFASMLQHLWGLLDVDAGFNYLKGR